MSAELKARKERMHAIKVQAHTSLARAIRHGLLPRPATMLCVDCGVQALHYDHRDYTQPLKVEPTCRKCNGKRGKADVWAHDFHPGANPRQGVASAAPTKAAA